MVAYAKRLSDAKKELEMKARQEAAAARLKEEDTQDGEAADGGREGAHQKEKKEKKKKDKKKEKGERAKDKAGGGKGEAASSEDRIV